ncbi:MAG: PAS domain-containing protein [Bacteroidales bacterium]|nr:PAS domain-containing protein [Bacteroidales bacterium]
MQFRYLRILFFIFLEIAVTSLSAQELNYRSDAITRDNGLSNSTVSCIIRDKSGFMWFGTWNGLNRYDGYELKTFHADPSDTNALSHNKINALFQDKDGFLWISTDDGLNCYDPQTGKFHRYYSRERQTLTYNNDVINGITQDSRGLFWISKNDDGLCSFNPSTGRFKRHPNPYSVKSNTVFCVLADNQNPDHIWIGTADGLFLYEIITGSYRRLKAGQEDVAVSVRTILQDASGTLFAGTSGNGLLKYDRKNEQLSSCFSGSGNYRTFTNSMIRQILPGEDGNIIMSISEYGLISFNPATGKITDWMTNEIFRELNEKFIFSVYKDPAGILWVGTYYDGINKLVPLTNSFTHYGSKGTLPPVRIRGGVTAILEDSRGYLWLGTRIGGLYRVDRKTGQYTAYLRQPNGANGISSNSILSIAEVYEGNRQILWIGTNDGRLNCFVPETGHFTVYTRGGGMPGSQETSGISAILPYDGDHILIGTNSRDMGDGIDVFQIKTGKFVSLKNNPANPTSLSSNSVLALYRDRSGAVWVGTRNGGLNKLVVKNINAQVPDSVGYFVRYMNNPADPGSLNHNTVYAIHEDSEKNLWVGTGTGGLNQFDPKKGTFKSYSNYQYFKNNIIYGILSDNNQNLWLSTSRGLIAFNLSSGQIHRFDKYDGLQENGFIYGSSFKSRTGELFFGGIQGCNVFHPDSIKINLRVPKIVITSLAFNGKKGEADVSALTGKSVLASKIVKTPWYYNNFSVSFSALDFQMPEKNRYKYKLDGHDQDWIETDASRRYVNYTNLSPGSYVFRVIGTNSDDVWNHAGTSVQIIIQPPFWNTTIFRGLLGLIIAGAMAWVLYRAYVSYQKGKRKLEQDAFETVQDERWQLITLIDSMPDLIFIKDRDSRFTVANKRTAAVMGTTPENLIGKTDFDFYTPDLAQSFYNAEQEIMRTGNPLINFEEPSLDELGNRIIQSTTKVPYRNKTGEIIGLVGICRDITRLKRIEIQLRKKSEDVQETNRLLEERQEEILFQSEELTEQAQNLRIINTELERLNRTKDKFFSIIAHDLRNPFNAIIGFSELLRNDFYEMDNQQKLNLLELINVSSETAYNLLENLLQWARTQTDKIKYNPENFDLSEVVNLVINLHGITAQKKNVLLKNDIKPHTLVYADKNMINTVLRNLISNAIKYSKPEGEIVISTTHTAEDIEVNVIDTGVGMNRESLGKLFRIDTYYSTSGTMGESGTGLGLIICKEFVEKNNGRIRATSLEGEGTTLTFTLIPAKLN